MLTEDGLSAMNHGKPMGIPALISLYKRMAKDSVLVRELKVCVDYGEVMPNIPHGPFFLPTWEQPCRSPQRGELPLRRRCEKLKRTSDAHNACKCFL